MCTKGAVSINWRKPVIKSLLALSGSNVLKNLEYIRKIDSKSEQEIKAEQEKKLKALLLHAYKHVPYYRLLFPKVGVITKTGKVKLDNFSKIPFLTKDIIRKTGSHLYSDDHANRNSYFNTSGGSTGEPIKILQDRYYKEWNIATKLFYTEKVGKQIGEKEIKLWGSERDLVGKNIDFKLQLTNWLFNRTELNAFLMSESSMQSYVKVINVEKPNHIWTYADSIYQLAKYIEQNDISIHSPNSIITTAGVLEEEMREYLEKVFSTNVFNQYGSREVGDIAAEDREDKGLRVFSWSQFVELIEDKVYITNLNNYSMPLIRYEIRDTATKLKSIKGSALAHISRLENVTGRISDHFVKKDGTLIGGGFFRQQFYFRDWVKQFKIVQEAANLIICYVVPESKIDENDILEITKNIRKIMGNNTKVRFEYVNKIAPSNSGKHLYTESLVEVKT